MLLQYYLEQLNYKNMPLFLRKYFDCPSLNRLMKVGYFCGMDFASKSVYDFSGTYKVMDEDTVIIMSDESGNKNEYEYKIKEEEGLSPKQLTLIPVEGATTSTKYENFWLED